MIGLSDINRLSAMPKAGSKGDSYRHYRCDIPVGQKGDWSVENFEIENNLWLWRMARDGRGTPPGQYTRLMHKDRGIVMSDTNAEIEDHRFFFARAKGRVLIHGLGLGMALKAILQKKDVVSVDCVELEQDVIDLVGVHFKDPRLTIHHGDAMTYKWPKGTTWDIIWHDIWDNICSDNLPSMKKLCRKFGKRCNWQGCWARERIRT